MPTPLGIFPGSEDEGLNLRLWTAVVLPPISGGVGIVVGYIVSNYDCNVHNRRLVVLVSLTCLILCIASALLVLKLPQRIESIEDDPSRNLRMTRLFLRKLALWLSAGFSLLLSAGLLSVLLLGACDL